MQQRRENSRNEDIPARRRTAVVLLVPGFPADESDTSCLPAVQNYVAALAALRRDLDVHVIAFQYPYTRSVYRWRDVTVHALAGVNRTGWRRIPTWLRAMSTFARLRTRADIRVLHTFWLTDCTYVGQWLGRMFRVRHIASIGGQDAQPSNPYLRRLRLGGLSVTAGSRFAAEIYARHHDGRSARVIPLGLDIAHLETIEPASRRDIDILGVGSLIPLKDYAQFVDVIAALASEFPGVRACIVGGGPEHEALVARIARRGLEDNLMLSGPVPRDEAFRYMLRSRILLHTSAYESQAYVFLEALFAGLDVVCYDVGHAGDTDKVHRCSSVGELVAACAHLLRDPPAPARQQVVTVEETVRAFEHIYGV